MCGIAGAVGFVDELLRDSIITASNCQAHRGPDGKGYWGSEIPGESSVFFAHRRLAIIDLHESSNQPMIDSETGVVIVYNGEVYNFQALRSELEGQGYVFRTQCDTEVVLKAYIHWGEDCVNRLRGMFAFALYDPQYSSVFLVRDRVGIKPLYFTLIKSSGGNNTLLFASELRALLSTNNIERNLNPVGLSTYLWNGFVAGGDSTIVQGIKSLEPGHYLKYSLESGDVKKERYWQFPAPGTIVDCENRFESLLQEAVEMHMVSDVPLGIFLSGGVDSSALAAMAARSSSQSICTFNISFDEPEFDESRYARRIAERIGAKHTEIKLTRKFFKNGLENALGCLDQPTFDGINTFFVSRAVREAGITVALAGTGGDELFGGYRSFREMRLMQRISRMAKIFPSSTVKSAANLIAKFKMGSFGLVPPQTGWGKLENILLQNGRLVDLYQISYAIFKPDFIDELSDWEVGVGCRSGLPLEDYSELEKSIEGYPPLHATSFMEFYNFLGGRLLPDTDSASMANSLEVRVPLLDHVLIEYVFSLQEKQRFFPLGKKSMLRNSIRNDVDLTVFDRLKSGFELPLEAWCQQELNEQITDMFADKVLCEEVGLNPVIVNRLWIAFQQGAPGLYWSRIWAIYVLLWWAKTHRVILR